MTAANPASSRTSMVRRAAPLILALATMVALAGLLHHLHTPWADLARYAAYIALGLTLPGTLVLKSLRGSLGSWLADLGLGTTLGMVLQLPAWMAVSLLDVRGFLWLWPVVTLPLVVVRGTRRRILERPTNPWPLGPLVLTSVATFFGFLLIWGDYARYYDPLPPTSVTIYQDLLWHMGLAAEARRAFPLQTPQVLGDGPLHYHWFSNAHVAASSMISGSDQTLVWLRLWWVPVVMLGVLLTAELGRRVIGSAWAGAGAALLGVSTVGWLFWPGVIENYGSISAQSPSQLFSIPVSLLAMYALVDVIRATNGTPWGSLTLATLGMAGCTGAKASTLPIIVGGIGVAFLAALALRRSRGPLFGIGAVATVLLGAGQLAVAGSPGNGPMLLHILTRLPPYKVLIDRPDRTGLVADGLWNAPGVGKLLLPVLMLSLSLTIVRVLSFVIPAVQRPLRRDVVAWLLAGSCLAALLVFFTLSHGGYSQLYFYYGAIPFGSVLWAWSCHELLRGDRARQAIAAATALLMGSATVWAFFAYRGRAPITDVEAMLEASRSFLWSAVVFVGVLAAITLIAVVGRSRRALAALLPIAPVALLTPFLVGAIVPIAHRATHPPAPPALSIDRLDEARAGEWIADNVPEMDVMTTNIHCLKGTSMRCDSRKWWISGLGQRRVLLESWGYTPRGAHTGYYDPALWRLHREVFFTPTAANVAELKAYGVTWLVADTQPGNEPPSPDLANFGTLRYSNSTISIYQLDR